jgi:hypothetical protein
VANIVCLFNVIERALHLQLLHAKGMGAAARSHWLEFSRATLQTFLDASAVPLRLELSEEHAAVAATAAAAASDIADGNIAGSSKRGRALPAHLAGLDAASSSIDLLRQNLVAHSPLVQGKADPFPAATATTASVFPLRERRASVLRMLARPGAVSVDATVDPRLAADAVDRLRRTLTDYHDCLQVYHPAVHTQLRFDVGATPTLRFDAASCTMHLNCQFVPTELVRELQRRLPGVVLASLPEAGRVGHERTRARRHQRTQENSAEGRQRADNRFYSG